MYLIPEVVESIDCIDLQCYCHTTSDNETEVDQVLSPPIDISLNDDLCSLVSIQNREV